MVQLRTTKEEGGPGWVLELLKILDRLDIYENQRQYSKTVERVTTLDKEIRFDLSSEPSKLLESCSI